RRGHPGQGRPGGAGAERRRLRRVHLAGGAGRRRLRQQGQGTGRRRLTRAFCGGGFKSSASLRSRALIRPPGTFSRKREKGFSITLAATSGTSHFPAKPEKDASQVAGAMSAALLLRSGRRWRAAPDEGASGASCFGSSKIKGTLRCARAPSSALRAPSPVNGRRASSPSLAARIGISPSPAKREKVARSAG